MSRNLAATEKGGHLTPRLCPWNWFYFAGIRFLDASRNFAFPCFLDRRINGVVEAFQQRSSQSSTGCRRESQSLFKSSETSGLMSPFYPGKQIARKRAAGAPEPALGAAEGFAPRHIASAVFTSLRR